MNEIVRVRNEVRMRQWAEMIRCRNESGLSVSEWCEQNGINIKTYYYRLKRVRETLCSEIEQHDIVSVQPVSKRFEDAYIRLLVGNIKVEIPDDFNADTLKRLLGVLQ